MCDPAQTNAEKLFGSLSARANVRVGTRTDLLIAKEHRLNSLEGPVNLFFLDDQGWRKTHGALVSFLAQQAFGHKLFAKAPGSSRLGPELHAYHKPLSSNLFDMGALDIF